MSGKKILFSLTGSIACYKACHVISRLVQAGHSVQTTASQAALEFIGQSTLEGLTGRPVFSNAFESGRQMDHIHLSRWADLHIVCPSTANTINKLANGIGDEPATLLFLAHDLQKTPFIIAPAMNHMMFKHPATQDSIQKLRKFGVRFIDPDDGPQACGETGPGRLADPDRIFAELEKATSALGGQR